MFVELSQWPKRRPFSDIICIMFILLVNIVPFDLPATHKQGLGYFCSYSRLLTTFCPWVQHSWVRIREAIRARGQLTGTGEERSWAKLGLREAWLWVIPQEGIEDPSKCVSDSKSETVSLPMPPL